MAQPLIDAALGANDDDAERAAAVALLRKQAWRFEAAAGGNAAAAAKARAKAYALLARRGFPPDAVREALDEVLAGDDGAAP